MASEQHWDALRGDETGSWVLRREAESRIASLRTALAAATDTMALQRKQLRNAWAKLECRCIFNEQDEKTHEDSHCPYHGWYNLRPDEWDPIGDLRAELATATARADDLERQLTQMHKAANMALDERDKATARAEAAEATVKEFEGWQSDTWRERAETAEVHGTELALQLVKTVKATQAQRERAEAAERERDELISRTHQTIIFSCGCRVILDGLDAEPILMFCQTHKGE